MHNDLKLDNCQFDPADPDVDNFAWYRAFATFHSAVVMQQLYNRYTSGQSSDEMLAGLGRLVPGIAERVRALLTGEGGGTTC